jgi:hypothetical protein
LLYLNGFHGAIGIPGQLGVLIIIESGLYPFHLHHFVVATGIVIIPAATATGPPTGSDFLANFFLAGGNSNEDSKQEEGYAGQGFHLRFFNLKQNNGNIKTGKEGAIPATPSH